MNILNVARKISLGVLMAGIVTLAACENEDNLDTITDENSSFYLEKNVRSKGKDYSYNVEEIYTRRVEAELRSSSEYDITYVIPTRYKEEQYDFRITTLNKDGSQFNVSFDKEGKSYSSNFYVKDGMLYGAKKVGRTDTRNDSFLGCVASHEGTALGFLTGACAGIASFIPFLQPLAFACAAETAVIAATVAADCAING